MRTAAIFASMVMLIASWLPARADEVDPASGYRLGQYRAPVTRDVVGGRRIDLREFDTWRAKGAVLVDVMPARAGYDPKTGKWRLVEVREDIPGSVWLPNVGQGMLEPRLADYFAGSLERLTAGRRDQPLVIYCMADCWMSWNAVKRAATLGYTQILWFAEGTDGWVEAGRKLVAADPPPVPPARPSR